MFAQNLEETMNRAARVVELEREVAVMDSVLALLLDQVNQAARAEGKPSIVRFNGRIISDLADASQTKGRLTYLCQGERHQDEVILDLTRNR